MYFVFLREEWFSGPVFRLRLELFSARKCVARRVGGEQCAVCTGTRAPRETTRHSQPHTPHTCTYTSTIYKTHKTRPNTVRPISEFRRARDEIREARYATQLPPHKALHDACTRCPVLLRGPGVCLPRHVATCCAHHAPHTAGLHGGQRRQAVRSECQECLSLSARDRGGWSVGRSVGWAGWRGTE